MGDLQHRNRCTGGGNSMSMFHEKQKSKARKVAWIGFTIFATGVLLMCMPYLVYGPGWQTVQIWPGGGPADQSVVRVMLCIPGGFVVAVIGLITWVIGAKKKKL